MIASLNRFLLATAVADGLVKIGVPFRETHHFSGRMVIKSEELGILMDQLSLEQLQAFDSRFPGDIKDLFTTRVVSRQGMPKMAPAEQACMSRVRSSRPC